MQKSDSPIPIFGQKCENHIMSRKNLVLELGVQMGQIQAPNRPKIDLFDTHLITVQNFFLISSQKIKA